MPPDPRFIPAPAGNTADGAATKAISTVHPRACGEHMAARGCCCSQPGSSPRLRGTLGCGVDRLALGRFIPAPAGNTRAGAGCKPRSQVHPRACGEHASAAAPAQSRRGSSPRLRGTRDDLPSSARPHRFIPAPAGNTMAHRPSRPAPPVHPRACGEHTLVVGPRILHGGSSPRLRGTHRSLPSLLSGRRFIPAPAGNTCSRRRASRRRSVHPRACGEHMTMNRRQQLAIGSSPRLRGTHDHESPAATRDRFIPAHAGNTCFCRPASR